MAISSVRRMSFRPTAAEMQQMKKDVKEQSSPAYLKKVINGLELKLNGIEQQGVSPARAKDLRKQYSEQLVIYKNKLALAEKRLSTAYKQKAVWIAPIPPKPVDPSKPSAATSAPPGKTTPAAASPALYDAKGRGVRL